MVLTTVQVPPAEHLHTPAPHPLAKLDREQPTVSWSELHPRTPRLSPLPCRE